MARNRIINSLSYLSILFLPVLFPLIVWFLTGDNPEAHHTAGRAFWLQVLPAVTGIIFLIVLGISGLYMNNLAHSGWLAVILMAILAIIAVVSYFWAIIRGIQILVTA